MTASLTVRVAEVADVDSLLALVHSAYRGPSGREGWTSEADLIDGPRTTRELLARDVADPTITMLVAGDLVGCAAVTLDEGATTASFGMFAVPREQVVRVHASSGTTGKPTVVGYTRDDIDTWAGLVARSLRAAGVRPGDVVHVAYGYGLFTGGLGAHYGVERLGCTAVPMSGGQTEKQIQLIHDFGARAIMVTPSYMLTIVDAMQRQGIDPAKTSLRTGVFGAEPWTEQMRTELEATLAMDAVDIYGLSEVMGPGVAQECVETKDGLHI